MTVLEDVCSVLPIDMLSKGELMVTAPAVAKEMYANGVPATPRQIEYINVLKVERRVPGTLLEEYRRAWRRNEFNANTASRMISEMMFFPRIEKIYVKNSTLEGIHNVNGRIIKVKRSKTSGYLYTKELTQELSGGWSFAPLEGGMKLVSEFTKISLKDAKKFGKVYGSCCVCGRTLTDTKSLEAGIGPVCAARV